MQAYQSNNDNQCDILEKMQHLKLEYLEGYEQKCCKLQEMANLHKTV